MLVMYPRFLRRFPSFRTLAAAAQSDVVRAWKGMGYNNRAVRLHKLAQSVMSEHKGKLPADEQTLLKLPGIGKYTANAILCSVHGLDVPIVDVNVRRVFSRIFRRMKSTAGMIDTTTSWRIAQELLPRKQAYNWNQALMDLGATVCTARSPKCGDCPVGTLCSSRNSLTMATRKPARKSNGNGEPSFKGIPNRIYRGRIIDYLRNVDGMSSTRLDVVASATVPGFSKRNARWLLGIINGLKRDGLIIADGKPESLAMRISLA